ncbi:UDP-3-O-[3-hydroxymyristoyl] N-acetylglucosamine deacetylase [Phycisphaerae bacterium RAS1]|nr:UDP-3-O-[3-hydroxymyristoyl] N-acetylglucosamine deacetylase [Phycisphaerae bacterium RAS1]
MRVCFRPAPPGSGITFVRADQPYPIRVRAHIENLAKRPRRSSLRNGTVSIETVEHCLAAIRGLEIDNVDVELDNQELPAGDGSSQPYVDSLQSAGIELQDAPRETLDVTQPVRVLDGDCELVAWPGEPERLDIIYELDYGAGPLKRQIYHCCLAQREFVDDIAPARTFIFDYEVAQLRAAGLGAHLTYKDVLVIGPDGPIENEFRFPDECVRHKILDLIGDLMLAGSFVCGKIYARRSGHHLNHELVRRLTEVRDTEQAGQRLKGEPKFDIRQVSRILPHRYPMLLVDRVVSMEADQHAVAIKNVTINEPFFEGHYPRQPIMPGVLIIEALAQLSGILLSQKLEHTGKVAMLLSLDKCKFRRPVVPGDQLVLEAHAVRVKSRTGQTFCEAKVNGELVAEASIRFMMVDADPI